MRHWTNWIGLNETRRLISAMLSGALIAVASGCAVQKDWVATGGSRSDGVVRLSFEMGAFEKPEVSDQQAQGLAAQRCRAWGYTNAEAFGGIQRRCNVTGGFGGGCQAWTITKEFQCLNG